MHTYLSSYIYKTLCLVKIITIIMNYYYILIVKEVLVYVQSTHKAFNHKCLLYYSASSSLTPSRMLMIFIAVSSVCKIVLSYG